MNIDRALARIERIDKIIPHDNANSLEIAKVVGWQVVVQKGLYQPQDIVAFFEVDSFIPILPGFEFLYKSSFRSHPELGDGYRIKTIKLRGQISQGLIMPLSEIGITYQIKN